jgi:hypothetical protein
MLTKLLTKTSIKIKAGGAEISTGAAEESKPAPQQIEQKITTPPTVVEEELQELEGLPEVVHKKDLVIFDRREFSLVVTKIKEIGKKSAVMLSIDKIEYQMKYATEKTDELVFLLNQNFMFEVTRVKKISTEDPLFQREYKNYTFFVDGLKEKLKNFYRIAFKENNFENYSVEEFNTYIEGKNLLIAKFITEYFNEYYFTQGLLKKEEVFELHRRIEGKQRETVNNIFLNAKRIFNEIRQQLINLDVELDNFIIPLASRD